MPRRLFAGLAAAALVSVALPSVAGARPARVDERVGFTLYGDLAPAQGDPRAVAAKALRAHAKTLGVDASRFAFGTVRKSFVGTHVRGTEVRGGVPVDGTHALVTISGDRVIQVAAYGAGDVTGGPVANPVGAAVATLRAHAAAHVTATLVPSNVTRVLVPTDGTLVDTYRVSVLSTTVARTYEISAADGRVLAVRDDNQYEDGKATAFDPNPIVTARNAKMRQPGVDQAGVDTDLPCPECDKEMKTLPLKELDADQLMAGKLIGPWADIIGPSLPASNGVFTFSREDVQFETTMAYAHIDRIQRYFQKTLGFSPKKERGVNDEPQTTVTLHIETYDNSFYQPGNDVMVFGTGGVDDAEDAEVIVHEYGHAVQDAQVQGWGSGHEGGSMGEGFGDFLAAAYYARTSKGYGDLCVADWDATSYSTKTPPCLRRMDSKKQYPDDLTQEVHADGELWSAYLWRLRAKLGSSAVKRSDNALRLVLTSHELLTPDATFADAIAALRTAAKSLKHPEWVKHVNAVAKQTSMPWNE